MRSCGIGRKVSNVLAALIIQGPSTSLQIQMSTMSQQPVVSVGLKEGIERGWITALKTVRKGTGGRPTYEYHLAMPVEAIITSIEAGQEAKTERVLRDVKRLREMVAV